MSSEVREHAFEHGFTRAPDAHRAGNGGAAGVADGAGGGIGVGLTVAQRLVERHGGSVRVAETSQRGTVMEVRLPALERASATRSRRDASRRQHPVSVACYPDGTQRRPRRAGRRRPACVRSSPPV
jgi:hypothetical protein